MSVPNCHIKASTLVLVCIQQYPRTSLSWCASCYDCREERCGVVDNRQPSNSQDKIGLNVLTSNRRSSFSFYSSIYNKNLGVLSVFLVTCSGYILLKTINSIPKYVRRIIYPSIFFVDRKHISILLYYNS